MGNPETKLWKDLKEGTKELGVFWTRIESWAMPGIPDVHGIKNGKSFWLELKVSNLKSPKVFKSTSTSNIVANSVFS